ncbi:MAG TPA: NAD-dependent epimerase/dehydratase family protein, partial [Vicinamibacterales bacterium]|nr:NAD-dependent epimerase/dehydratase family protein [Vicinamibacterales bacterium]
MKVLVLGGTRFVGRHIVESLLARGHQLTVFNRGQSHDDLPPSVERLRGDRDGGAAALDVLDGRRWDACIDVSGYTPRQVRPSAERLCSRGTHYVYVSAVMTYGDAQERPVRESHPQLAPAADDATEIDGQSYGPLKVACERIVRSLYGDDGCALLRPQIVVGPGDPSGRYAYWVHRARRGGAPMLAPGDGSDHLQVVDVLDLARFAAVVVERRLSGAFNVAGPRFTWHEFLEPMLGARRLVWVPSEVLQAAGVSYFELPLYRPEHGWLSALMDV